MARPGILAEYRATMVRHVMRKFGISEDEAMQRITEIMKKRYKPVTAVVVETLTDGDPKLLAVDLVDYLNRHSDDLVSPSGSFYCQHEKKTGATIQMIQAKLKQRKVAKKAMLRCKAIGDTVNELIHYYEQTLLKIGVNSLPGNYGSKYSIFYDKGNYNAITSAGRALIGYANTCIEHVLGGNFGWFSFEQLLNHITIHLPHVHPERVEKTLANHRMRRVTKDELFEFYKEELQIYHRYKNFDAIREEIDRLNDTEVQYFWYYQNLRHVLMGNDEVFRPWIEAMFDLKNVPIKDDVDPEDLFKLDGALVTMINVAYDKDVSSGNPEIQVYDLPKKMPEKAKLFVNIANYVSKKLDEFKDVLDTFIFTDLCVPDVLNRKAMIRNSSVVSDTDSVIFTVKDWVDWYTHDIYKIYPGTYHIACLMIYWIQLAVAHALELYSIAHGARGSHVKDMAMKNEFLYPTMIEADIKKTYAGVITVQEGVILPKPTDDIKGVQLKGSTMVKDATEFANKFIVQDLLLGSLNQKISGHDLLQKVMAFEQQIYRDIMEGKTKWCEPLAIKNKDDYATPLSQNYFYYMVWEEVFADKYGTFLVPNKTYAVPIDEPTPEYFELIRKTSPVIAKKFEAFILKYGKAPSKVLINPNLNHIPEELIPLVKTRDIIADNVNPCRLILRQLGISCGFDKDNILFTEIYGDHSMLALKTNKVEEGQQVV